MVAEEPVEDSAMTTLQDELTPDVRDFVERERLLDYLRIAETLIREHFPGSSPIRAELVEDPDSEGDAWISLTVQVAGSIPELLEQDDGFVDSWIREVPWPERDRIVLAPWPV
jgi:hypothetical protein